jgi:two-component system LytT family response regulator
VTTLVPALVADDEAPARVRIVSLLAHHSSYRVVAECDSGPATLAAIRMHRPALVFLDVQMPGCSGIDVWRSLDPSQRPVVVFTTAYDEYALAAFEARAIDFLLKPYSDERFEAALERAERLMQGERLVEWERRLRGLLTELSTPVSPEGMVPGAGPYAERFAVREGDRIIIVPAAEVDWIEAARDYVRLHIGSTRHLLRMTMHGVEARLDPKCFLRVHRSAIAQVDRIVRVEPYFQGEDLVILRSGTKLPVGRSYRRAVQARLGLRNG